MDCGDCLKVFEEIGSAFNSPMDAKQLLRLVSETMVRQFDLKGCHFRLLSRDEKVLEHVASYGLSDEFLEKGPVDADKSARESLAGKRVMIEDCGNDPRIQYRQAFVDEGIASMLTVPLKSRDQVLGVMRLSTAEPRSFKEDEQQIIGVVASFCTSAIIHAMFHGILERVNEVIRTSLDLKSVLQAIVRVIGEDLRGKGCMIQLLDEREGRLKVQAADGLSEGYLRGIEDRRGRAIEAALAGEAMAVLEAWEDSRVPSTELAAREGIGSMLFLPLAVRDRVIGVLTLCTHHPWQFSDAELFLLGTVADQCALAVRNAQMYASVKQRYDTLTVDFQTWFEHYSQPRSGTLP
jgi:GAF domain-containing protein